MVSKQPALSHFDPYECHIAFLLLVFLVAGAVDVCVGLVAVHYDGAIIEQPDRRLLWAAAPCWKVLEQLRVVRTNRPLSVVTKWWLSCNENSVFRIVLH